MKDYKSKQIISKDKVVDFFGNEPSVRIFLDEDGKPMYGSIWGGFFITDPICNSNKNSNKN